MFNPPNLVGKERRLLSLSLMAAFPVRAGSSLYLQLPPLRVVHDLVIVLKKNDQRLVIPCMKAAYAACGWYLAILAMLSTSVTQDSIFLLIKSATNCSPPRTAPRYVLLSSCCCYGSTCSLTISHDLAGLGK